MAESQHGKRLAIYCFAWDEGGPEKRKLKYQENIAGIFARWSGWADEDCEVYRDVAPEGEWVARPQYDRLKRDIYEGKIARVWALGKARLHPFGVGREALAVLCTSRNVEISFGILGEKALPIGGLEQAG